MNATSRKKRALRVSSSLAALSLIFVSSGCPDDAETPLLPVSPDAAIPAPGPSTPPQGTPEAGEDPTVDEELPESPRGPEDSNGEDADAGKDAGAGASAGEDAEPATAKVLHTKGRQVLDTCGNPFIPRGLEQFTNLALSADGTWTGIARELVETGSNAVRILPSADDITAADLEAMLTIFAREKIVVYISPGDRSWFNRSAIRDVLLRFEKGLVLDAFQEPDYWDVPRWVQDTKNAIAQLRGYGFSCPLTVLADGYGRNLPAALEHGQEIVDSDPLHNTIVGWQAYWGISGWYQDTYGMSLAEGVARCAAQNFPMQIGIDEFADPADRMDFKAAMAAAQSQSIGWLWWDFWNPFGNTNSVSRDGTSENLTATGQAVVHTDPNSIANTAKKACFR